MAEVVARWSGKSGPSPILNVGDGSREVAEVVTHVCDSEEMRAELRKLLQWFYFERDRQSANRLEMATDADFYDNIQWDEQDAAELKGRGQMPLVFNEIAPMIDWLIGTERRTRVDWRVLPRTEDDVQAADIKTKVLKYVSDLNKLTYCRSRAFADAVKVGLGWVDDGLRDDPTTDILYSRYEDWRCVLHDSLAYDADLSDARYVFRWRWVDTDVARLMFPDRARAIDRAGEDFGGFDADWESDEELATSSQRPLGHGSIRIGGNADVFGAQRQRIKLIECQYRKPVAVKIVADGPMKGSFVNLHDSALMHAVAQSGGSIIDKVTMRVHVAVFTERDMLWCGPSPFRHNRFSLTPVWGYRRSKDRLPYGAIRRVRDIQQDLNKRASKALHALNTNQVIMDEGAATDIESVRDEAQRPDGLIVKKPGRDLAIRTGSEMARGQLEMMQLDAGAIQRGAGISNENLGRQTNAVSGEAIKARQLQGSVVTTEFFDNLRLAVQCQGEKLLSMCEQFYSEEKVIRLTGQKGALEWVKVNAPEQQPDGSIRYINDISSSVADFVVSEADFAGTMRQTMFEALNNLAGRLPPEVSLRLLTIAFEYSDLPNKDEVADQIRKITGERDPEKALTPEEAQQMEQQMQAQAEALQMQRMQAQTAMQEQQAKVREINARALKLEAEVQTLAASAQGDGAGDVQAAIQQAVASVQAQAANEIDQLSEKLRGLQSELANRTLQIRTEADVKLEAAHIDRHAKERVAQIQAASNTEIARLAQAIDAVQARFDATVDKLSAKLEEQAQKPQPVEVHQPATRPETQPTTPATPLQLHVHVDANKPQPARSVVLEHDADGRLKGAKVVDAPNEPKPESRKAGK